MNNQKELERNELHKTIWKMADDLRGSVDGWDFKQYVLGLLFYRFISENLTSYLNEEERKAGNPNFDYTKLSDEEAEYGREDTLADKGFYILPSELFCNLRKRASEDKDLNITLGKILDNIENSAKGTASEDDMKGLFDDLDFNSNKLGNNVDDRNTKIIKMLNAIGDLKLGDYKDNTIDLFGDAYEFLMTMYASNAGKSGGEFFTPQEVGDLLAKITTIGKKEVNKVYDPCCGSGSLLLKFAKVLGKENVKQGFYGQELNITSYNLCRVNMFLHNINYNKFNIKCGDTLIHPMLEDKEPFDVIVSNPPYSQSWEGDSNPLLINDPRFSPAGVLAPKNNADFAFIMHMLSWLSSNGTAAIVVFPGILYRGFSEEKIRKYMIDNNYIDTIIQLPNNIFFQTPIGTAIMVLKKNKIDNNILFIDASNESVKNPDKMKNGNNSHKLSDENIENILTLIKNRTNEENKSVLVTYEEISNNSYNLSVNSYLKVTSDEEEIDIVELNKKIKEIVEKQDKVRKELDQIIEELESDNNE